MSQLEWNCFQEQLKLVLESQRRVHVRSAQLAHVHAHEPKSFQVSKGVIAHPRWHDPLIRVRLSINVRFVSFVSRASF